MHPQGGQGNFFIIQKIYLQENIDEIQNRRPVVHTIVDYIKLEEVIRKDNSDIISSSWFFVTSVR